MRVGANNRLSEADLNTSEDSKKISLDRKTVTLDA